MGKLSTLTRKEPMSNENQKEDTPTEGFGAAVCSPHPLLDDRRNSCKWIEDSDGYIETECNEVFYFEDDWTKFVKYCQSCGGVVWIPRENIEENS